MRVYVHLVIFSSRISYTVIYRFIHCLDSKSTLLNRIVIQSMIRFTDNNGMQYIIFHLKYFFFNFCAFVSRVKSVRTDSVISVVNSFLIFKFIASKVQQERA